MRGEHDGFPSNRGSGAPPTARATDHRLPSRDWRAAPATSSPRHAVRPPSVRAKSTRRQSAPSQPGSPLSEAATKATGDGLHQPANGHRGDRGHRHLGLPRCLHQLRCRAVFSGARIAALGANAWFCRRATGPVQHQVSVQVRSPGVRHRAMGASGRPAGPASLGWQARRVSYLVAGFSRLWRLVQSVWAGATKERARVP